jgi:hypothetical protein
MAAARAAGVMQPSATTSSAALGSGWYTCFQITQTPKPVSPMSRINCHRIESHFTSPRFLA